MAIEVNELERLFEPQVLLRGVGYYEQGLIKKVRKVKGGWKAVAQGSCDYDVFVPSDPVSHPELMSCDCPYFEGTDLCKHLAAACLCIADRKGSAPDDASEPAAPSASELVATLNEEQLRALLLEELKQNDRLERTIVARYGTLDAKAAAKRFASDAREVFRDHAYRGFIDWHASMAFERDWLALVDETVAPFLDRGDPSGAFDLACAALMQLQKVEIDDSNGFFSEAAAQCEEYWRLALDAGDDALRRRALGWFSKLVAAPESPKGDKAGIYWLLQETADSFMIDYYADRSEFAGDVLKSIDGRIEALPAKVEKEADAYRIYNSRVTREDQIARDLARELAPLVLTRMRVMETLGCDQAELDAYAADYLDLHEVRFLLVGRAEKDGDFARAIELLEAGKKLSEAVADPVKIASPLFSADDLRRLYELHVKVGDDERARELLIEMVVASGDSDLVRELKQQTPAEDWPQLRDSMLARMTGEPQKRRLLVEEGMAEELWALVSKPRGDVRFSYGSQLSYDEFQLLAGVYPKETLQMLKAEADRTLAYANKSNYATAADLILRMRQVSEGGPEFASKARTEYEERYHNRSSMLKEFKRLG